MSEYGDDDYDDEYNDETYDKESNIELQATFKDIERVSVRNVDIEMFIDMLGGKNNKPFRSDIKKFVDNVYNVCRGMMEDNVALLNKLDLEKILENMVNLNKPGYKNASAYILGYIASNGGTKYTKESAKKAFTLLKKKNKYNYTIEDTTVDDASIVRYSILWINMKNKL